MSLEFFSEVSTPVEDRLLSIFNEDTWDARTSSDFSLADLDLLPTRLSFFSLGGILFVAMSFKVF